MIEARLPDTEADRLAALYGYNVLDTEPELGFDDLTQIASNVCGTPIALVSLVDVGRQWFKSRVGLEASETPRNVAFCSHAILEPNDVLVVSDSSKDERFHDNPLATGPPHVKFYAGAPLVTSDGHAIGTLCVIDDHPRDLDDEQIETLRALSRQVVSQLELRKANASLRSTAEELSYTNGELKQFASIAAHDLQEPLRQLMLFSEMLTEDIGGELPPRAAKDLTVIVDASRRMSKLVSDILAFSQAGSRPITLKSVDLNGCAEQALDAMSIRVGETGARVTVDRLPRVQGDQTLLTQLFQNLISNAIKFCRETPEIHITCAAEDGVAVVGVKDNGIGMESRYADQIFEPFKRLHGRREFEGTGIGLAIAHKAVTRHSGRIWVEAVLGEGSHFKFTLQGMQMPVALAKSA